MDLLPTTLFEITKIATLENLAPIRTFIDDVCRQIAIDQTTCFQLKLAVDEVCANIIMHGYAGREAGPITVSIQRQAAAVEVVIADWGISFAPGQAQTPDLAADWETRSIGGLGLFLVQEMMDEVIYHADLGQGNRLILKKRLNQ
jgi:anti-sigma regulatory factor (Ser/Thr protein kinase)